MTTPGCKQLYPALRFFFFNSSAAPAEVGVGGGGGGGGVLVSRRGGRHVKKRVRSGAEEEEEAWQEVALGSRVHFVGSAAAARLLISFAGEREREKNRIKQKAHREAGQRVVVSEELRFHPFDRVFRVVGGGTIR